ncbi:hypothetical protein [Pimelobacter simplex]|uniref:hypothetical protein n=1 Tax=Nocardioides simplex TaxID=2045 RepID=UPI003AB022B2
MFNDEKYVEDDARLLDLMRRVEPGGPSSSSPGDARSHRAPRPAPARPVPLRRRRARVDNRARRPGAGRPKVYRYPRWQFCDASEDVLGLCTAALDQVEIPWRRSNRRIVSVSRREGVARLDALVGPKV